MAQATTPGTKDLRLIRSVSGTKGVEKGALYEIEDPRTSFSLPDDRQVTVYFEWEGDPGSYHFEGRWKDPTGRVVLVAPMEYVAKTRRFGVRWTLALPESVATGLWALEVAIEGRASGTHAFTIGSASGRQAQSTDEIYRAAIRATAGLLPLGTEGAPLGTSAATALDADHVVTSFAAIEGAVRVRLQGGGNVETQNVTSWNRREGWAILKAPGHGLTTLSRSHRKVSIGDRVFILEALDRGDFALRETKVVGSRASASGKGLLRIDGWATSGSPALDAGGEAIGVVVRGGEVELGSSAVRFYTLEQPREVGAFVVPFDLLPPADDAKASTLEELGTRNVFAKPLSTERRQVISGVFAARVDRSRAAPMPIDQKVIFSRREGQVWIFIEWAPQEKREALSLFEVYDGDNRLLGKSDPPSKLKFKPGELVFSTWAFTVDKLPPGIYRVDALLEGKPVWRGHLQITE